APVSAALTTFGGGAALASSRAASTLMLAEPWRPGGVFGARSYFLLKSTIFFSVCPARIVTVNSSFLPAPRLSSRTWCVPGASLCFCNGVVLGSFLPSMKMYDHGLELSVRNPETFAGVGSGVLALVGAVTAGVDAAWASGAGTGTGAAIGVD